ncbi:hypothetical protein [Acinetobacter nosocomialis]|uniref:hypothetical protein n=1 Tax=Acinetobacter nosocomialis TaxID=106654 RepID=UPI001A9B9B9B|nr:hypothetical protein [Acinetobacter nosocomialis]MBO1282549.1 hypothetical protein [Acinetobacter nosocomialis]
MRIIHIILFLIFGLMIGILIGLYLGTKSIPNYDSLITACVMVNKAEKYEMLDRDQIKELGLLTGSELKSNYPVIADHLSFYPQNIHTALEATHCNKFLQGFKNARTHLLSYSL